jgi:hypothetical protein
MLKYLTELFNFSDSREEGYFEMLQKLFYTSDLLQHFMIVLTRLLPWHLSDRTGKVCSCHVSLVSVRRWHPCYILFTHVDSLWLSCYFLLARWVNLLHIAGVLCCWCSTTFGSFDIFFYCRKEGIDIWTNSTGVLPIAGIWITWNIVGLQSVCILCTIGDVH